MKKRSNICNPIRNYICPSREHLLIGTLVCIACTLFYFLLALYVCKPPKPPLSLSESLVVAAFMGFCHFSFLFRPWIASEIVLRRITITPEELASDFEESEAFFDGRVRIGNRYIYVSGEGKLIPTAAVDRFGTMEEKKYHSTYITASGDCGNVKCQCYSKADYEQLDIASEIRRANEALRHSKETF